MGTAQTKYSVNTSDGFSQVSRGTTPDSGLGHIQVLQLFHHWVFQHVKNLTYTKKETVFKAAIYDNRKLVTRAVIFWFTGNFHMDMQAFCQYCIGETRQMHNEKPWEGAHAFHVLSKSAWLPPECSIFSCCGCLFQVVSTDADETGAARPQKCKHDEQWMTGDLMMTIDGEKMVLSCCLQSACKCRRAIILRF